MQCPTGVLRARHTGILPAVTTLPQSPSSLPRWFPSLTQKQEHIWECTGGLCHTELCHGVVAAQEKKGGEGQRHEGEGGGERRGAKLPLCKPPLPTARSAHWEGAGARVPGRSAPVPSQGCGAQLHKPPRPWSHCGSSGPNGTAVTWQEDIDRGITLGPRQAPALAAAAVLQHVFHRGRAATWNQPRARPLSPQHSTVGAPGQGGSRSSM